VQEPAAAFDSGRVGLPCASADIRRVRWHVSKASVANINRHCPRALAWPSSRLYDLVPQFYEPFELLGWPDMEALGRLIKIFCKLPTGEQLFRQKLGGLKPGFYGERCILFSKQGGLHTNAHFQIFCRRRIGTTRVFIRFQRLLRRQREQFSLQRVVI
jgi:hypothetical protein